MSFHPLPRLLGEYRGKKYSRYLVVLSQSGLGRDFWQHEYVAAVVAESPKVACWLIKDEFAPLVEHPTEIECAGPKGDIAHLFIDYETMIWAKMCAGNESVYQLELFKV